MKWSFAAAGMIIFGIFGILIIMLFNDITVSNEQDYFNLKDVTEAAMMDAVDVAYYRLTGEVKISQEKFVENFTRRFTEVSTFGSGNYDIEFYQIVEYPAKVSVRIVDRTNSYNIYTFSSDDEPTQATIVNQISAILDKQNEPANPSGNNQKETYTITYHGNGGTSTKWGDSWSETVEYGQEYRTWANWYTNGNCKFKEWNEDPNGHGIVWGDLWIGNYWHWTRHGDVDLYAIWQC